MSERRPALAWGAALVALGIGLLLRNLDVLPAGFAAWPFAVLTAGIVLLVHGRRSGERAVFPVVLVVVGGVFLLREAALVPAGIGLGPLVLITVGALLVAGSLRRREDPATTAASVPLDGIARAHLRLGYGAGTLRLTGGAAAGLLYQGAFAGGVRQDITRTGDRLDVALRHARGAPRMVGWSRPLDWELQLGDGVPIDLEVHSGASKVDLDLRDVPVRSLKLETGASDVDVVLPAHGTCRVEIEAGAADVRVRVPEGVAASVRSSTALASVDIDAGRFPTHDGVHESPGFPDAIDRSEIRLEGGLASFSVR